MTLNEFKLIDPEQGRIRFFLSGGDQVVGMTISIYNCNNVNFTYPLQQLKKVTVNGYEIVTTSKTNYSTYFYYDCEPTSIDPTLSILNDGNCDQVQFFPNIDPIPFTYNMYNAIIGNTEDIRESMFVYDVDRKSTQLQPSNIQAILSSSATLAKFQDSNYSDTGLVNARYEGTKTSTVDYGIQSSIAVQVFDTAVYPPTTDNNTICSQSLSDRTIVEYGFDNSQNLYPSLEGVPTASFNYSSVDGAITGTLGNEAEVTTNDTSFTARMKKSRVANYKEGDILILSTGQAFDNEYIELKSITYVSNVNTDFANYLFTFEKNIDGPFSTITGTSNSFYGINIIKIHSDTVYSFEGNKIVTASNKKLYLPLNKQVVKTVKGGKVIKVELICSV